MRLLLTILITLSAVSAMADTMKCTAMVYKGEDFLAGEGSQQDANNFYKKAMHDFEILIGDQKSESYQDSVVNGVKISMTLWPMGQSKSFNSTLSYNTGVEGRPSFEAMINDVLYFNRTEDGKPSTESGEWPFPGKNLGDVYSYNTFKGGALGLTRTAVQALQKAGLFNNGRYSYVMSLMYVQQLREDILFLRSKGLIQDSDVVAIGTFGDCYLTK